MCCRCQSKMKPADTRSTLFHWIERLLSMKRATEAEERLAKFMFA